MKKKIILLLSALFLGSFAFGCSEGNSSTNSSDNSPEGPALEFVQNKIEMLLGESKQLSLLQLEAGETVSYTSNDEGVLTVTQTGLAESKGIGYAVVKATTSLGRTAFVQINVHDPLSYPIPYISVAHSAISLGVGEDFLVEYTHTWLGESIEGTVEMTSKNTAVATVENGRICAVGEGQTEVVLRGNSNYGETEEKSILVVVLKESVNFSLSIVDKVVTVGKPLPLTVYVNEDGVVKKLDSASFRVDNPEIAKVEDGKILALQSGNTALQISVQYGGTTHALSYAFQTYEPHNVTITHLNGEVDSVFTAVYGDEILLEIANENGVPEYTKALKCWYVNGEELTGSQFIMPDEDVEVTARFINETQEDFASRFVNGHLINNEIYGKAEYVTDAPMDSNGATADLGGAVKFTTQNFASTEYRFDEEMVVNEYSKLRMRLYCPEETVLIYLGVPSESANSANTKYEVSCAGHLSGTVGGVAIQPNTWVTIEIPLVDFVSAGGTLNGVDIAAATMKDEVSGIVGGEFYIDYISIHYGLSEKDAGYQDKILYEQIVNAQAGSAEQKNLLVDYYYWTNTLTETERETDLHKSYVALVRAIVTENFPNGLEMSILSAPNVTGGEYHGIPEEKYQNNDYKSDAYKDIYLIQFRSDEFSRVVSLGKLNYMQYPIVSFGLFAMSNFGSVKLTIEGQTCTVPEQGYCRLVVENGVLKVYNDCRGQDSTLLMTVQLRENVLNGTARLNIGVDLGAWQNDGWAGLQITEYHTYIMASDFE